MILREDYGERGLLVGRGVFPSTPLAVRTSNTERGRRRTQLGGPTTACGAPNPSGEVYDWVIVGGGPHGVSAARALTAQGATVRIVDPGERLLHRWYERSEEVAMTWMRSPLAHHLDAQPSSLDHFLHRPENGDVSQVAGKLRRPTHGAFLRHSREVVTRHRLDESLVRGRVEAIRASGSTLFVAGESVGLRARRVLVATGSNVPRMPGWARELQQQGAPVRHLFEAHRPIEEESALAHDIVGGGISAVQRALLVHRTTQKTVRLWMRRPVRVADFDLDRELTKHRFVADWTGRSEAARLEFLGRNRAQGSLPAGIAKRLKRAVRVGGIEVHGSLPRIEWDADRQRLLIRGEGATVESKGLTLGTGFTPETVSGWLRMTAEELDLPIVSGLPRLAEDMHWGRGIYMSGPLARLRLGPMAHSVIGARWATSKLPSVKMQPV